MTLPQKNSNFVPWKWALIGAGSTVLLGLAGFGLWNLLNHKTSSTSTSVTNATPKNYVYKKIIGQWQTQSSGNSLTLIFTPEGKLFIILQNYSLALEGEYQTDLNPQPKYLDILVGGKVTGRTIFDFTADGQLRLELDNINVKESRPTSFSNNARIFQKISEQTALPHEVIVDLERREKLGRQSEAKQYVASLNKGQQAFYIENARFTSSLQELGLGIKSETENYSYSIVLSNDKRLVQAIGLSKKDGLKNYTGIVYLVKSTDSESTSSLFCESNQPSKELPGTPAVTSPTSNLQCPLGYSPVVH
ncbi:MULTISPECIES: type IV pilin-like G/H family protein [unclassified Microcoleus]|uniref:type IV pilin-like G/H family protein n=1 Tax=unclassified Microcoleus TaxID=2642155 RepID=UPI002FD3B2F6